MRVSALDSTILEELVDLGPVEGIELVRDLMRIFFEEAPKRMARLHSGLANRDSREVAQAAHSLQGGSSGLGAVGLASICASIERQARAGDLTGVAEEIATIEQGLPRLEERIGELVQKLAAQQAGA